MLRPLLPLLFLAGVGVARADVVLLKDGRTIEGVAVVEGEFVVVSRPLGAIQIPRDQVASMEQRETPEQELARRASALGPGDHAGALSLLQFCIVRDFEEQARILARQLQREAPGLPGLEGAWLALDFRLIGGEWVAPEVHYPARGFEKVNGRWLGPEDVRVGRASRARDEARKTKAAAVATSDKADNSADVAISHLEWARTTVERLERTSLALHESARSADLEVQARRENVRRAEVVALSACPGDAVLGFDLGTARSQLDAALARARRISDELARSPAAIADARSYLRRAEAAAQAATQEAAAARAAQARAEAALAVAEAEFGAARRARDARRGGE